MAKTKAIAQEEVTPVVQEEVTADTVEKVVISGDVIKEILNTESVDESPADDTMTEDLIEAAPEAETDGSEEYEEPKGEEAVEEEAVEVVEEEEEALEGKYDFCPKKLEAYLNSVKQEDKIIQASVGGNFVSNRDFTVYVPLSLFIK
jgi:hypothetical protein